MGASQVTQSGNGSLSDLGIPVSKYPVEGALQLTGCPAAESIKDMRMKVLERSLLEPYKKPIPIGMPSHSRTR
jgi:hypothetical protein